MQAVFKDANGNMKTKYVLHLQHPAELFLTFSKNGFFQTPNQTTYQET